MAGHAKRLVLMQGLPGSGKSTVAREIAADAEAEGLRAVIRSTDDFFTTSDGHYAFDEEKLPTAHRLNEMRADRDMEDGVDVVIVDNTFTRREFAQPYVDSARKHGYEIEVRLVDPGIDVCKARNAERTPDRRIPDEVIDRMHGQMEELRFDDEPEQKLYHASAAPLGVGTRLFPRSQVNYSQGDPNPRVFVSFTIDDALEWAQSIGLSKGHEKVYIYEVEPLGRVYKRLDIDTGLEEGHCQGAIVTRCAGYVPERALVLMPCEAPAPAVRRGSVGMTLSDFYQQYEGDIVPHDILFEDPLFPHPDEPGIGL